MNPPGFRDKRGIASDGKRNAAQSLIQGDHPFRVSPFAKRRRIDAVTKAQGLGFLPDGGVGKESYGAQLLKSDIVIGQSIPERELAGSAPGSNPTSLVICVQKSAPGGMAQ